MQRVRDSDSLAGYAWSKNDDPLFQHKKPGDLMVRSWGLLRMMYENGADLM